MTAGESVSDEVTLKTNSEGCVDISQGENEDCSDRRNCMCKCPETGTIFEILGKQVGVDEEFEKRSAVVLGR